MLPNVSESDICIISYNYIFRFDPANLLAGAQPDMTALHYAIIRENEALAFMLIQYQAQVNIPDR